MLIEHPALAALPRLSLQAPAPTRYRAIRAARRRVVIANAYFFPGYRLVRELRLAARRGANMTTGWPAPNRR